MKFPNETKPYRNARDKLLKAELDLRKKLEAVAALRRKLPAGGEFAKDEPGQNARHVDSIWPLWNLLDFTPEGRGRDWYPKLSYSE